MQSQGGQREVEDLDGDYAAAGFRKRLGFGRSPAVLNIDFVNAYLDEGSPLYAGVESARDSAARVLAAARAAGVPVIHTVVTYQPGGADGGHFYRKVDALRLFEGESNAGSIVDELAPVEGETLIRKQFASAFFGTSLAPMLTSMGCDSTIILGLSTSGCVRASALDAVQHGFIPIVVADAVGDRDRRPHEQALFDLDAKYADVVSEAEVLEHLASLGARRPEG